MRLKKWLAGVLALAMVASMAACGSKGGADTTTKADAAETTKAEAGEDTTAAEGNDGEVYTIRFFDKNSGTRTFDDKIALELMKRTGVNVDVVNPTGDPAEKLSLMLAAGDYPDIVLMDRSSDIVNQYIEAGALIPISDYFDLMPHVQERYGEVLNKSVYSDGKNYYLNNWYGVDPDPVNAFCMRHDLMVDLLGEERAESDEPFTWEEFVQLLKDFKAKYPTIDGAETYPLGIGQPGTGEINGAFAGANGVKTIYVEDNGDLHFACDGPGFKDAIYQMNELYREGLLDPEWTSNASELFTSKLSNTNVFGFAGAWWGAWTPNAALDVVEGASVVEGVTPHYLAYKVLGPSVTAETTTYSGRSTLGWDAIGVTKNCTNIEAVCKFIDYCVSEEGQDLLLWGIQGEDWDIVDGVHTDIAGVAEAYEADPTNYVNENGICKWTWFVGNARHEDGTATRIYYNEMSETATYAYQNITTNAAYDTADFAGLQPAGQSMEALAYQTVIDDFDQYYPKMVNASSVEEVDTLYDEMIAKMNADGKADVEAYMNDLYQARMELWGMK